jgi:hypothetical protein
VVWRQERAQLVREWSHDATLCSLPFAVLVRVGQIAFGLVEVGTYTVRPMNRRTVILTATAPRGAPAGWVGRRGIVLVARILQAGGIHSQTFVQGFRLSLYSGFKGCLNPDSPWLIYLVVLRFIERVSLECHWNWIMAGPLPLVEQTGEKKEVVTYQRSCHMTNVQKLQRSTFKWFIILPGCRDALDGGSGQVLRSAGMYNILIFWVHGDFRYEKVDGKKDGCNDHYNHKPWMLIANEDGNYSCKIKFEPSILLNSWWKLAGLRYRHWQWYMFFNTINYNIIKIFIKYTILFGWCLFFTNLKVKESYLCLHYGIQHHLDGMIDQKAINKPISVGGLPSLCGFYCWYRISTGPTYRSQVQ